ncbi:HEAT repeat domain-containing protein [Reinekea sp. G2M2-21]|uniref:HEAT repeat domain-containing protein n=1 Tax=Reinekea sp. G2M2-21 TaxID=2788942 RepID=UPI0018AB284B|nr:HEAT repeat domain-containing protein [Reinekea sp. G2M2-21]
MKHSENFPINLSNADRQLIMAYLYDDCTEQQRQDVERRAQTETDFGRYLTQEQALNDVLNNQPIKTVSSEQVSAARYRLHTALNRPRHFSLESLQHWLWPQDGLTAMPWASLALMFVIGFWFAQGLPDRNAASPTLQPVAAPLQFIRPGEFEITNLKMTGYDVGNGDVQLTYSLVSRTELNGNLGSADIQQLLAESLQDDVSDATRLDLVGLLKNVTASASVRAALSHSLLNDPNPGVRLLAAEALTEYAVDPDTRHSLLQALANDVNAGVRIVAFQSLMNFLDDPATLDTIQRISVHDSNRYIRDSANRLVEPLKQPNDTQI